MKAVFHVAALLALLLAACEGPTLEVGELIHTGNDAGEELDASVPCDASDARIRDANFGDRDLHLEERRACLSDFQCADQMYRRYCDLVHFWCVECTDDRQCDSHECIEAYGYCRLTTSGSTPGTPPGDTLP